MENPDQQYPNPQHQHSQSQPTLNLRDQQSIENSTMSQNLKELKSLKRKGINDAMLLSNRITLLRLEEGKTQRKIEEARKKAVEIINRRQEHENQTKEKMERKKLMEEEQERKIAVVQERKLANKSKINELRELLQAEKHREIKILKETQLKLEASIKEGRNMSLADKKSRYLDLKQEESHRLKKLKEVKDQPGAKRDDYETRRHKEIQENEAIFRKIESLEAEERTLMAKLQATQSVHREAYHQLNLAVSLSPRDYLEQNPLKKTVTHRSTKSFTSSQSWSLGAAALLSPQAGSKTGTTSKFSKKSSEIVTNTDSNDKLRIGRSAESVTVLEHQTKLILLNQAVYTVYLVKIEGNETKKMLSDYKVTKWRECFMVVN